MIKADTSNSEEEKEKCPGESFNPQATPGVLCLYQSTSNEVTVQTALPLTFGAQLLFAAADETYGSWAVKAE
jgi:hypothetical protein